MMITLVPENNVRKEQFMEEAMRNLAIMVWTVCAINTNANAVEIGKVAIGEERQLAQNEETVIYGASRKADGSEDAVVVEQPADGGNPLGNPIVDPDALEPSTNVPEVVAQPVQKAVPEQAKANNGLPQSAGTNPTPQQLGKQFQNTLMEANGMVYDVQAYPEEDLKAIGNPSDPATLYSPNVNP